MSRRERRRGAAAIWAWAPISTALVAACAQPPSVELGMAEARVSQAVGSDAATFAPELLAEAEGALAEAKRLTETEKRYRAAIRAAAQACLRADEAFAKATVQQHVFEVRLERLVRDIDGLLEMAAAHGAAERARPELEALRARHGGLGTMPSLMEAYEEASRLKPEVLALEQRFRVAGHLP